MEDKPLGNVDDVGEAATPFGVFFRDDGFPYARAEDTFALTTVRFDRASGRVRYADMEINTAQVDFSTGEGAGEIDLQTVVTHEVGHYVGLAHSRALGSIMNASLCQGATRCDATRATVSRRLSEDDIDAVCTLFPPGAPTAAADPSVGCSVGSETHEPWGRCTGAGPTLLLCGSVFAAVRRRRGSRSLCVRLVRARNETPG